MWFQPFTLSKRPAHKLDCMAHPPPHRKQSWALPVPQSTLEQTLESARTRAQKCPRHLTSLPPQPSTQLCLTENQTKVSRTHRDKYKEHFLWLQWHWAPDPFLPTPRVPSKSERLERLQQPWCKSAERARLVLSHEQISKYSLWVN